MFVFVVSSRNYFWLFEKTLKFLFSYNDEVSTRQWSSGVEMIRRCKNLPPPKSVISIIKTLHLLSYTNNWCWCTERRRQILKILLHMHTTTSTPTTKLVSAVHPIRRTQQPYYSFSGDFAFAMMLLVIKARLFEFSANYCRHRDWRPWIASFLFK